MPFKDKEKQRACARESYRRHGKKWAAKRKSQQYEHHIKYFYGLSLDEYNALKASQDGKCAICRQEAARLFVDHIHDTNGVSRKGKRVRGLLCSKCNLLIGHAKESVIILAEAIRYLERHGNNSNVTK